MKKYILILILVLLMAGCSNKTSVPEPIMEMEAWESLDPSELQADFFQSVIVMMGTVNTEEKTTVATVTMPDLDKYLNDEEDYDGSTYEVEIVFPVEQIEEEWQITSIDPLIDYIRNESDRILIELIVSMGGIEIDFDPQEVPEE